MINVPLHRAARELKSICYMVSDRHKTRPHPDDVRALAEALAMEIQEEIDSGVVDPETLSNPESIFGQ
jgi:hypothetical protein